LTLQSSATFSSLICLLEFVEKLLIICYRFFKIVSLLIVEIVCSFIRFINGVAVHLFADRYMYCEKCFNELPEDGIDMADDPLNPGL